MKIKLQCITIIYIKTSLRTISKILSKNIYIYISRSKPSEKIICIHVYIYIYI